MKLAFCIFKYFPYGGLQRDMYRAAEIAIARGHHVDIYTMHWQGPRLDKANINIMPVRAWTNHTCARVFSKKLKVIFNHTAYDCVIGFNKIPGLDIYFTGENCFAQHVNNKANFFVRYLPRYYFFSWLENKLFSRKSLTKILLISPFEKKVYQKFYHTQDDRFHFLLPAIEKRSFSDEEAKRIRKKIREKFHIGDKIWLLFVASDYALKGLRRVLEALKVLDAQLAEKIVLSVLGQDNAAPYQEFLNKHAIQTRVDFLGASDHVYEMMTSADLLVHPARLELAGKVIIESMVNHLPVLTTQVCGCAPYVEESFGGEVLQEPFSQDKFVKTLQAMLDVSMLQAYRKKLAAYPLNHRFFCAHEELMDYVEMFKSLPLRHFYLDAKLMKYLPQDKQSCIRHVFSLQGEVYREVKNRKTIEVKIDGENYFVKMHYGVGWREILKNIFVFKSVALGAKQEYQAIRSMNQTGILVPQVCAYATSGINPANINSFIITKRIHYQSDLEKFFQERQHHTISFVFKRRLIRRVAEIAKKMHDAGMNHRDFYLCHFLLDARSEADFDLYLIDLHRVQVRKKLPWRWRVKDLSGLYFSAMDIGLTKTDEYFFLQCYYDLPLATILSKKRWSCWWIKKRAQGIYRRHQKKIIR